MEIQSADTESPLSEIELFFFAPQFLYETNLLERENILEFFFRIVGLPKD